MWGKTQAQFLRELENIGERPWGAKQLEVGAKLSNTREMVHPGREPDFMMRVVKFNRFALARQTGEAVRIRRRGVGEGTVLNSKGEFNHGSSWWRRR